MLMKFAHRVLELPLVVTGDGTHRCACPRRSDGCFHSFRGLQGDAAALKFQLDLAFRMLRSGRADLLPQAKGLLGDEGVDTADDRVSALGPHRLLLIFQKIPFQEF